jgi:hypothetical protein
MRFERYPELALSFLGVALLLPAVGQPFLHDDLNSIYQAAVSLKHPGHLLDPWMGGLLRFVPKLHLMSVLAIWGPDSQVLRLHNLALHGMSVFLVARVFTQLSGSSQIGLWSAAFFALGFGFYARAVIQVSNVTMVSALTLFLAGLYFWQRTKRRLAAASFAMAALCHEVVWAAPLLVPFWQAAPKYGEVAGVSLLPGFGARRNGIRNLLACFLLLLALTSLLPGWPGRLATTEMEYVAFGFIPLNVDTGLLGKSGIQSVLGTAIRAVVESRPWLGFAALVLCFLGALRLRGIGTFALGWTLLFLLPFSALAAARPELRPENWLDRRYLYFPAVGLCALVAALLNGTRIPLRRALTSLVVVWCLLWSGLTLWKFSRDIASPAERRARETFNQEMEALDPRWSHGERN